PTANGVVGTVDYERIQPDRRFGWAGGWIGGVLDDSSICDVADRAKPAGSLLCDRTGGGDARILAIQFSSRDDFFRRFGKLVHRIHVGGAGAGGITEGADDCRGGDTDRVVGLSDFGCGP